LNSLIDLGQRWSTPVELVYSERERDLPSLTRKHFQRKEARKHPVHSLDLVTRKLVESGTTPWVTPTPTPALQERDSFFGASYPHVL
jgi:hypothetical protein